MSEHETDLSAVGAVVVHFHRERETAHLVAQLVLQHGLPVENVVVADNGSTPGRLDDELARVGFSPTVLGLPNHGYAAAVNAGVRALSDEVHVVAFLTHEVELGEGCVRSIVAHLDAAPRSLLGPVLGLPNGEIWSVGGQLSRVRLLPRHGRTLPDWAGGTASTLDAEWLDGAMIVTTRSVFEELGGLDERYFLYGEDIDLGLRALSIGAAVRVVLEARAVQSPSGSIDSFLWTRNMFLLFRAHRHPAAWSLWLASCFAGLLRDVPKGARRDDLARRWRGVRAGVRARSGPPPP